MLFEHALPRLSDGRRAINDAYLADERAWVQELIKIYRYPDAVRDEAKKLARQLVQQVRSKQQAQNPVKSLIHEYSLSTQEGIVLMCLAEALLRIPDAATADKLIHDKLALADWNAHTGRRQSLFVNASSWAMLITGKIAHAAHTPAIDWTSVFDHMVGRVGEPLVRTALKQGVRWLGSLFVMGSTIDHAIARAKQAAQYRYSFDMLGESALTREDAERYFHAYRQAIEAVGENARGDVSIYANPSISVKLSALHPRYEFAKRDRLFKELLPKLLSLAQLAKTKNIGLTIDAEESDRLDISLDLFEYLMSESVLRGWGGVGVAVQAYQKRAVRVIEYLAELAKESGSRIPVRLVKGAYWDGEIKRAQDRGYSGYPVYTRKAYTDVSYLACAQIMLRRNTEIFPQFATHNAHTVAAILALAKPENEFEFQRLHGMGDELYSALMAQRSSDIACRVYAPVGNYQDLLPYLVRRLLENGANTSFVTRLEDDQVSIDELVDDPFEKANSFNAAPHNSIPLPVNMFGEARSNSQGLNLFDHDVLNELSQELIAYKSESIKAGPIVDGKVFYSKEKVIHNPATLEVVGTCGFADVELLEKSLLSATQGSRLWSTVHPSERATRLSRAADLFEQKRAQLISVIVREGGRTVPDAIAEVREAIDYCRYYAAQADRLLAEPTLLPGPTGEQNSLYLVARGVFACISPWNFPVAIFTGQIAAALVTGNVVIAKPASQTPLAGYLCCKILHEAGIPHSALQYLPCDAKSFNEKVLGDKRVEGVVFTGSTDTAHAIQHRLVSRGGAIIPFIAETGGQNVMIADSSALPEQVVIDALQSAFNSAGQRCSALRVLCVQEDIAERVTELLVGYVKQWQMGDPGLLMTDVGPLINRESVTKVSEHVAAFRQRNRIIYQGAVPATFKGHFFAPCIMRLEALSELTQEVFGPVLHVLPFKGDELDQLIESINTTGFGLTLGVQSRIDENINRIVERARVGNIYVNRNMIGAVVGVQPFGGQGMSGTGPKAGGPHYLTRFCAERTVTVNTAAVGGNVALLKEIDA